MPFTRLVGLAASQRTSAEVLSCEDTKARRVLFHGKNTSTGEKKATFDSSIYYRIDL